MKRAFWVAAVMVVTLLVVSASPTSAAGTNNQTIIHTTDDDFANAQTLTNVSIEGAGAAASVDLNTANDVIIDDFNDGDISEYGGTTSDFGVTTDYPYEGSHALYYTDSGGDVISDTDVTVSQGDEFSFRVNHTSSDGDMGFIFAQQSEGSTPDGYGVGISNGGQSLTIRVWEGGSVTNTLASSTGADLSGEYAKVDVNWNNSGGINVALRNSSGTAVAVANATDNTFSTGGIAWRGASVHNWRADLVQREHFSSSDGIGTYISANHSVQQVTDAFVNLTLSNVTATVTWQEFNSSGWETIQSNSYTTTGNKSLTVSPTGEKIRVNVTLDPTGSNPVGTIHDEGVIFVNDAPGVDNSTASPTGLLNESQQTLSIQVTDPTFGLAQGDTVTANFSVDGDPIGTDTLTSNGTASKNYAFAGGDHTWSVSLTDSYGGVNTSNTFSVSSPSNLSIRQESAPDQLVDDAEVRITAYYSGEIQRRTTTNGNISLENFPLDEPIIVRANASGYYTRTTVIESVFSQNSVYLLNSSNATYLARFDLRDPTGSFPREGTVLFVERDLNRSGNVSWHVIAGDNFGVQGVPVNLIQNERYRLRIKNLETGQTNVIGAYTAIQSETVIVEAGSATVEVPSGEVEYSWEATKNRSTQSILVEYLDTANQTDEIKITIHERYNSSNVLVDNDTFTDTNELMYQVALNNEQVNTTWTAVLYIDRGDGFTRFSQPVTGGVQSLIPAELDELWVTAIGVFVLLISAMAFSQLNTGTGAVMTSLVGGVLYLLGVLAPTTTAAAVTIALFVSLVFKYREGT